MKLTKREFKAIIKRSGLKLCRHQPFNDYRDWYIDNDNTLFVFYATYVADPEGAVYVELIDIKYHHKDEPIVIDEKVRQNVIAQLNKGL